MGQFLEHDGEFTSFGQIGEIKKNPDTLKIEYVTKSGKNIPVQYEDDTAYNQALTAISNASSGGGGGGGGNLYGWTHGASTLYTKSVSPSVGDKAYMSKDNELVECNITSVNDGIIEVDELEPFVYTETSTVRLDYDLYVVNGEKFKTVMSLSGSTKWISLYREVNNEWVLATSQTMGYGLSNNICTPILYCNGIYVFCVGGGLDFSTDLVTWTHKYSDSNYHSIWCCVFNNKFYMGSSRISGFKGLFCTEDFETITTIGTSTAYIPTYGMFVHHNSNRLYIGADNSTSYCAYIDESEKVDYDKNVNKAIYSYVYVYGNDVFNIDSNYRITNIRDLDNITVIVNSGGNYYSILYSDGVSYILRAGNYNSYTVKDGVVSELGKIPYSANKLFKIEDYFVLTSNPSSWCFTKDFVNWDIKYANYPVPSSAALYEFSKIDNILMASASYSKGFIISSDGKWQRDSSKDRGL